MIRKTPLWARIDDQALWESGRTGAPGHTGWLLWKRQSETRRPGELDGTDGKGDNDRHFAERKTPPNVALS
jgi:hypothetical protein